MVVFMYKKKELKQLLLYTQPILQPKKQTKILIRFIVVIGFIATI